MLFIDKNDSLEPVTTNFEEFKAGSRYAKIDRARSVINPEKPKRYNPLSGSFANECTLSIIPDLTINAPKRLNAKIKMPKNMVQVLRTFDFEDANKINFYADNEKQLVLEDGALYPGADNIIDLGKSDHEFKKDEAGMQ